ncbi:hypothetical protein GGF50DRAFT_44200, partial [Schizophyllum commune]
CPGIRLQWDARFFVSYPFSAHWEGHPHKPGYHFKTIGRDAALVTIVSDHCLGYATENGGPCRCCTNLTPDVDIVRQRAITSKSLTGRSHETLVKQHKEQQATIKALRLEVCFFSSSLERLSDQAMQIQNHENSTDSSKDTIADWRRLYELIATSEVPGLQRLISTAYKEEVGVDGLLERVQKAINGQYHPKNYTQNDIDITMALYEFGGAGAVHAAHKSHLALPSLKTIRKYRQEFSLRVSALKAGIIADAGENIQTIFRPRAGVPRVLVGHGMGTDEASMDGRVCYLPATDEMGGCCREHAEKLRSLKMGDDLRNSMAAAQAVKDGEVHIAKEISCTAVFPHCRDGYGAKPIILSPTCKRGLVSDSIQLLMSGIRAWQLSPNGERMWGPLWYLTSDGDATRRNAMYKICMRKQLDKDGELYKRLRGCIGLNLWTNPRHIGLCTLLCSKDGLMVKGVHINKVLLSVWLEKLTEYDWSAASIHALLNPKDAQDVPRAIKLLLRVTDLRTIDTESLTPSERVVHSALALLGEAFHHLLEPYLNRHLSLSQQITQLVEAAHLFCALYLRHTTDFISNQLYGDIQCMIKNAVFIVAKSQILNPELEVFICLLGDDLLEALFGRVRMLGRHSPNVDVSEMATRCRSALNLADIFSRHPEWERKPERLEFKRSRDYDHINPHHWRGNVVGKFCDIEACWRQGSVAATALLQKYGISIDFADHFSPPDRDLMRPFGGKHYPGVAKGADPSQDDDERHEGDMEVNMDLQGKEATSDVQAIEAALTLAWARLQAQEEVLHSVWMKLDNGRRERHKTSVLREVFDLTHDIDYHKTHDRILRIGNLFATLVRLKSGDVSLAIAQCTGIKPDSSTSLAAVPRAELTLTGSKYSVSGQVLSLKPVSDGVNQTQWVWDDNYVAFELYKARRPPAAPSPITSTRRGHLVLTTPASLIIPLVNEAQVVEIPTLRAVDKIDVPEDVATWVLNEAEMVRLRETLWARVSNPDSPYRALITTYASVSRGAFPYGDTSAPGITMRHRAGIIECPGKDDERLPCRICGVEIAGPDRQTHMGQHIYLALIAGTDVSATEEQVSQRYPCGFCGGDSQTETQAGCSVAFGERNTAASDCIYAHPFMVKPAANVSRSRPCTNVPMRCKYCPLVQWKYNMQRHLNERHPGWETRIDAASKQALEISAEEASLLPSLPRPRAQKEKSISSGLKRRAGSPVPLEEGPTAERTPKRLRRESSCETRDG